MSTDKKHLYLVYHHDDADGYVAAAVFKTLIPHEFDFDFEQDKIILNPMGYSDTFDIAQDLVKHSDLNTIVHIAFLDLSFNETTKDPITSACAVATDVIWIDHHAASGGLALNLTKQIYSEEENNYKNLRVIYDTALCGAALTYVQLRHMHNVKQNEAKSDKDAKPNLNAFYIPDKSMNLTVCGVPGTARIETSVNHDDRTITANLKFPGFVAADRAGGPSQTSYTIGPFLYYVDQYDLWQKIDERVDIFHSGLEVVNGTGYRDMSNPIYANTMFIEYGTASEVLVDGIITIGQAIEDYKKHQCATNAKLIAPIELFGYKFFIKNQPGDSMIFRCPPDNMEIPIYEDTEQEADGVIWGYYEASKKHWKYTIAKSTNADQNAHLFARLFGGGGHPGCAGFYSDYDLFSMPDNLREGLIAYQAGDFNTFCKVFRTWSEKMFNDAKETWEKYLAGDIKKDQPAVDPFPAKKLWVDGMPKTTENSMAINYQQCFSDFFGPANVDIVYDNHTTDKRPEDSNEDVIAMMKHKHRFFVIFKEGFTIGLLNRMFISASSPGNTYVYFIQSWTDKDNQMHTLGGYDIGDTAVLSRMRHAFEKWKDEFPENYKNLYINHGTLHAMFFKMGEEAAAAMKDLRKTGA